MCRSRGPFGSHSVTWVEQLGQDYSDRTTRIKKPAGPIARPLGYRCSDQTTRIGDSDRRLGHNISDRGCDRMTPKTRIRDSDRVSRTERHPPGPAEIASRSTLLHLIAFCCILLHRRASHRIASYCHTMQWDALHPTDRILLHTLRCIASHRASLRFAASHCALCAASRGGRPGLADLEALPALPGSDRRLGYNDSDRRRAWPISRPCPPFQARIGDSDTTTRIGDGPGRSRGPARPSRLG